LAVSICTLFTYLVEFG